MIFTLHPKYAQNDKTLDALKGIEIVNSPDMPKFDEVAHLRQQLEAEQAKVQELGDALTLLWVNEDRALWDIKAVENFDRLILKTGEIK